MVSFRALKCVRSLLAILSRLTTIRGDSDDAGEIEFSLSSGIPMNVDNWEELERVDAWIEANGVPSAPAAASSVASEHPLFGRIGIRLNPQVGAGSNVRISTDRVHC